MYTLKNGSKELVTPMGWMDTNQHDALANSNKQLPKNASPIYQAKKHTLFANSGENPPTFEIVNIALKSRKP
jgi:hypothetical protein